MEFPGIVLVRPAATPSVPAPPDEGRFALEMTWIDGRGNSWTLTKPDSGIILQRGVRGLGAPKFVHYRDQLGASSGSLWRGYRAESREVFWPLYLYSDGNSSDWRAYNAKFWKGMSPGLEGRWVVRAEDGTTRTLRCRYTSGGDEAFELDPVFFGWAKYGIYLQADQPYWEGEPIITTWQTAEPAFFFGPDRLAPAFHISKPPIPVQATTSNPGDVPAWPVWTLRGPLTSATLGVGSHIISVPFSLGVGDELVIDTRPTAQTAILNGTTDKTGDLGSFGFTKIPAGASVNVVVTINAPSEQVASASLALTPLYEWAF